MNFGTVDWIILLAYLAGSVTIGIWAKRFVEDLTGYMVAGRRVRTSLGVATFVATELGTVTFVYFGELGYLTGFSCFIIGIVSLVAYTMVGKTGFIIAALRKYRVLTIPEFYELRYSRRVRLVGGIILFVGGVLNMGIFLKFDGIFLSEVMGFGPDALVVIMSVMLCIVIAYTVLGGMFSIVVTDFMQFVVLTVGMLIATVAVLLNVDLTSITLAVREVHGPGGVDPFINPRFGWAFVVWVLISGVAAASLWQPVTSKALASESPEVARRAFFWTGLTFGGRAIVPMFWGIAALAYFGTGLPSAGAMPRLLGSIVPSGVLGLLVAGMLAASMSTYSAYLLAWSSVLARDVIGGMRSTDLPPATSMRITRIAGIVVGLFLLVFGLLYEIPDTAFQYLYVTGAMYTAGAIGCIGAGVYWKKANTVGAFCALIMGAVAPAGFLVLERFRQTLPDWILFITDVNVAGLLSFFLAAAGMIVGSLLTQSTHPPRVVPEES